MSSKFIKGAVILSASLFFVRLIGFLYIIPFGNMVGQAGLALYGYAYVIFSSLITLSGLGIPAGIAKFVSKYNTQKEYDVSRKMFRYGMIFMVFLGIFAFLIMYAGAPWFAYRALGGTDMVNTVEDVTMAIRMVSFALIIFPPMSIMRGFFQGNQDMAPTAISQLLEQIVRIALIIIGSFIVIYMIGGTIQQAVNISVFAAFIGTLCSLIVLNRSWVKKKPEFDDLLLRTVDHPPRSTKKLFLELISYALPFAVLSLIANAFQFIDMMTFNRFLLNAGVPKEIAEATFGIYNTSLSKIIMIPVSFAIAFGQSLIPEITERIQNKNPKGVNKTMGTAIMLTSFITVPAVIGMWLLSKPIFVMLFNEGPELNYIGGAIFGRGAFIALFMALNAILDAIMQGIGKQYDALKFLAIGIIIKIIGNIILIPVFYANGAIYATILAFTACIVLKVLVLRKTTGLETRKVAKRHLLIFIISTIMAISVWIVTLGLNQIFDYTVSRGQASMYVLVAGMTGVMVYAGLAIYFDIAKMFFGERMSAENVKRRFMKLIKR